MSNKVNDFENDTTVEVNRSILSTFQEQFAYQSNVHYRAESVEELLSDISNLEDMIQHFYEYQFKRLSVLDNYTKARNDNIYQSERRRKEAEKADHRAAHNFCKVINVFDVGYNTGIPIKKKTANEKIQQIIVDFDKANDIESLDAELWRDVSKFGRAYELHFRNQKDEDKLVISSVFETFVVYSLDVERVPLLGVRMQRFQNKQEEMIKVTAYTDNEVIEFASCSAFKLKLREAKREYHFFQEVPITEYASDRYRQSSYEDIISLVDLYDSAQSDTANYMTDLNDATLVISGKLNTANYSVDDIIKMKNANMLLLEDGKHADGSNAQTTANYIYKQYDVSGTESYKSRLREDIHTISFVPDLTDASFSGTQSGEAMKYKLFGFQQSVKTRQSAFKKGLVRRYRLLLNIKNVVQEADNVDLELAVSFTPNLPKAILEELKALVDAGVEFSQDTLLGLASFIEDTKKELDKLKKENPRTGIPYDFGKSAE